MRLLLHLLFFLAILEACHTPVNPTRIEETKPIATRASAPEAAGDTIDKTPEASWRTSSLLLGVFDVTFYWVAEEDRHDKPRRTLYDRSCRPLARVSRSFARKIAMEGTGRTRRGRVLNVAGPCRCKRQRRCYFEASEDKPWGLGVAREPLAPFRSIAVDPQVMPIGTAVYVPRLDGIQMPGEAPWGNFVHDGCLIASDRGGNVRGRQIDFFAGTRSHFVSLARGGIPRQVELHEGVSHCQRLADPAEIAELSGDASQGSLAP